MRNLPQSRILNRLEISAFCCNRISGHYGDGTLLDPTTVVIGSNFGDSSNHTCNNLPTIVAGGGYRHQAHTVLEKPTPLCNLYLELLHTHDIDAGGFGSSTKDLGLLAG